MSFDGYKEKIQEGDAVILNLTLPDKKCKYYNLFAKPRIINKHGVEVENILQTPYGALKCEELIGKKYGSKISLSKGWGYVLLPNAHLWTLTLPHRTQIIYTPDISMIVLQLELRPGSIVVESGTGSGSLSHALIQAVKPYGHLYTFDFHEVRTQTAVQEFKEHGLDQYVTVRHRDVCSNGFGDELDSKADAVILDLPHPWRAMKFAVKVLKETGGRICSFSPCIEQVQKSCVELQKLGFQELETIEILQTQYNVTTRHIHVMDLDILKTAKPENAEKSEKKINKCLTLVPPSKQPGHTGYLTFATLYPVWARQVNMNTELIESRNEDMDVYSEEIFKSQEFDVETCEEINS